MNRINIIIILFTTFFTISACNSPANKSTSTHVKDLVQSDVFGVLPEFNHEILVYNNPGEIEGEYLELAKVEIRETNNENTEEEILTLLKKEAKDLGGNGILILEKNHFKERNTKTHEVKAIAIYALDRIKAESPIVAL